MTRPEWLMHKDKKHGRPSDPAQVSQSTYLLIYLFYISTFFQIILSTYLSTLSAHPPTLGRHSFIHSCGRSGGKLSTLSAHLLTYPPYLPTYLPTHLQIILLTLAVN